MHLAGSADDVEQQVVPKHAHRHDKHIAGDDERLERLQQSHICKLGAAVGGDVLHSNLVNAPVCVSAAAVVTIHGSRALSKNTITHILLLLQ